jgi:ABC-2 type transport system ATP-binding protein
LIVPHDCILRTRGLTKWFGTLTAVDGLSLEIRRGELLGVLGPNGAGKTTTLKMMCGLLRPDGGTIEINGTAVAPGQSRTLRSVGLSPQNIVIWEMLTCFEQLQFAGRINGMSKRAASARARELLEVFGLAEKAGRLGKTLSGGMQRRLNIALGLIHGPEILFLDEPQAGLDPQSRVLVRDYVRSIAGTTTVVITTHDMEEAEKLADRVCIIDHGKVLVLDTVEGVKRQLGQGDIVEIEIDKDVKTSLGPFLETLKREGVVFTIRDHTLSFTSASRAQALTEVLRLIDDHGIQLVQLRLRKTTLEDVFIKLTGRGLRE